MSNKRVFQSFVSSKISMGNLRGKTFLLQVTDIIMIDCVGLSVTGEKEPHQIGTFLRHDTRGNHRLWVKQMG